MAEIDFRNTSNSQEWLALLFRTAVEQGWSDLKFRFTRDPEITATGQGGEGHVLHVHARVNRTMRPIAALKGRGAETVITNIKANSGIGSGKAIKSEDGLYTFVDGGKRHDVRVAVFPTHIGETLSLRIPSTGRALTLDDFHMTGHTRAAIDRILGFANGLTVVAGPMGSGKSTFLRAMLEALGGPDKSVWAVEDPVELTIDGVEQISINADANNGWPDVLTALRRSDLEVLMIGEIRNYDQASAALEIGNAGAQVISSIHANDSVGAVLQLMDLAESKPYTLGAQLRSVVSQRLVRTYCKVCGGNPKSTPQGSCENCLNSGFAGVRPVHEVLILDETFTMALADHKSTSELTAIAREAGMRTLRESAQELINEGVTSKEEVERVLGHD
ncbi:GspE/PulE family protein [Microbacterium sp. 77mftsu3.1]|uniref:GspE/PulE family protein n=1 Tax=Microbacterium sp. 77mftsu3.1 TaxID=1761802 RepID=UPI00035D18C2|nr:ATPase, T2SS/T4P/T4SS family [Microbacterium sp. 77mftsu3.1]SDH50875.1 general secretion pathway protein E [Microbacterium sp. 77mftsu3.1]